MAATISLPFGLNMRWLQVFRQLEEARATVMKLLSKPPSRQRVSASAGLLRAHDVDPLRVVTTLVSTQCPINIATPLASRLLVRSQRLSRSFAVCPSINAPA